MNKKSRASAKPNRKVNPVEAPPLARSPFMSNGYSMQRHVHLAVAKYAARLEKTQGSVMALLVAEAYPAEMVDFPPVELRDLPKRHGRKADPAGKARKVTVHVPPGLSGRLAAYAKSRGLTVAQALKTLIVEALPEFDVDVQAIATEAAFAAPDGEVPS